MSISKGNSKLGNDLPNIATTPIKACGNCQACSQDCYALKAYRMYPSVKKSWDSNYAMATNEPVKYFNMVSDYIGKHSPRFFRWHVSGDILSQSYLDSMKQLARKHKDTIFLAFTKMYTLNYSNVPSNLRVVFSAWPGLNMPNKPFPIAYMQDGTENRVPSDARECPGDCEHCGLCWSLGKTESVVFYKH